MEAAKVCDQDNRYTEFTMALRGLFEKMEIVDCNVVWNPIKKGKRENWGSPDDIPFCHTNMGSHVMVFGGMKAFQKKKPWRKDGWENDDKVESVDPEVSFVFCFLSDGEPRELLGRVSLEWRKLGGGKKLFVRRLAAIRTYMPVAVYKLLNTIHQPTFFGRDDHHP